MKSQKSFQCKLSGIFLRDLYINCILGLQSAKALPRSEGAIRSRIARLSDYKGRNADQPVYKADTALMAELRATERQAAQELGQWVARQDERHNATNLV